LIVGMGRYCNFELGAMVQVKKYPSDYPSLIVVGRGRSSNVEGEGWLIQIKNAPP